MNKIIEIILDIFTDLLIFCMLFGVAGIVYIAITCAEVWLLKYFVVTWLVSSLLSTIYLIVTKQI